MNGMHSNEKESAAHPRLIAVVLVTGTILLYGIASLLPDSFLWGVNHLAFLKPRESFIVLATASLLGLFFILFDYKKIFGFFEWFLPLNKTKLIPVLFGLLGAAIFYYFRINTDMYGDTRTLLSLLAGEPYSIADIFNFQDKEPLTRFIHQHLARFLDLDQKLVFQLVSASCGGIYFALLLIFIRNIKAPGVWKFLIVAIGLACGVNQLFFGHVEDYTLAYLAIVVFMMFGWLLFDGKKVIWCLVITFLIGTRLHIEMILLLPALAYGILYYYKDKYAPLKKWLQPSRIVVVALSTMIAGVLLYVFYYHADRYVTGDQKEIMTKIFLPVVNPLPAPHSYSLFSINHISDVVQQYLFISSPAVLLLFCTGAVCRRYILWREPRVIFYILGVFYFFVFNSTVNPMLTMPRDWDLLSLSAASVIFLSIAVSKQLFDRTEGNSKCAFILGIALSASLLSSTIFYINMNEERAGLRLEGIGKWTFKSYYQGSVYIINVGEKMIQNTGDQIGHREKTIEDLLPYASKPDQSISLLYYKLGVENYYQRRFGHSSENFTNALNYDDGNASALKGLGLIALQTKNFKQASEIFSFYNTNINRRIIKDTQGVRLEELCGQLKRMAETDADSAFVQAKLDEIYPLLK